MAPIDPMALMASDGSDGSDGSDTAHDQARAEAGTRLLIVHAPEGHTETDVKTQRRA